MKGAALLLLTTTALFMACSSGNPTGPADGGDSDAGIAEAASAVIGVAGGVVRTSDGTSVTVPNGALSGDIIMTVETEPNAMAPIDTTPAGLTYLLGPEGQQFSLPVTLTLAVDPEELPSGSSISDVVVYTAPRDSMSYVPLPTFPVDGQHVSAKTTHFSHVVAVIPHVRTKVFGLGGDAIAALTPSALVPSGGAQFANNHALFEGLVDGWKTKGRDGFRVRSARTVWNIDQVSCAWQENGPANCGQPKANTADLSLDEWIQVSQPWMTGVDPGAGFTVGSPWPGSLFYFVNSVHDAGLEPAVAIEVNCKGNAGGDGCLTHERFRERFEYMLKIFPNVRFWGLINEPDLNMKSRKRDGDKWVDVFDAGQTARYFVDGANVLHRMQHDKLVSHDVGLFAGEFSMPNKGDFEAYSKELYDQIESGPAPRMFPAYWGMHPYGDTTAGNTHETDKYIGFVEKLEKDRHFPDGSLRVWLTESGTMLEWGGLNCHDTDSGYGHSAFQKQYDGARMLYAFADKSRVDRVYWWQFQAQQCDTGMAGGGWDSALVDANGNPRPAYCALVPGHPHCDGATYSRDCGGEGIHGCTPAPAATSGTVPTGTSGEGNVADGCYQYEGKSPLEICQQVTSTQPNFKCTAPGYKKGSCGTTGLFGCCADTSDLPTGYTMTNAVCFYDRTAADDAKTKCSHWQPAP